jgi:hypothetical protein
MKKLLIALAFLTGLLACNNLSTKNTNNKNSDNNDVPQSTGPDASDLLKTLQGTWQSQHDSTYVLEILDTKMRHLLQGKLSAENDIEIDGSCLGTPCKQDSTILSDGWCFMEKGQNKVQCYIILACDKDSLRYRAIGDENGILIFKKR